jgi:hypothetical protein
MKTIIKLSIAILLVILIWMFPVILSAYTRNWWLCFLYAVWWMPAAFLTGIILILTKYEK